MVRPPVDPHDHVAWLAYWSGQTLAAIERVPSKPHMLTPTWDYHLDDVERCARAAAGRALRLSPRRVSQLLKG